MALFTSGLLQNIALVLVFIFGAVYLYFKHAYKYWKRLGVPNPKPDFFYGNFVDTIKVKLLGGEVLQKYYNEMKALGHKYTGLYIFHAPLFMPIHPDLIRNIMTKDFNYFYDHGVYHNEESDPLSAHLFSLNGKQWRNLRAKLTPTFTSGKLKKMFGTLVDCSQELKNCLNESLDRDEPIDIKTVLVQYTTDVIGSCAFGIECNSFKNPNTEFIQLGRLVFNPKPLDRIKMFFAFIFPKVAGFFKMRMTNYDVDKFFRNLVKETIEYREKNNITRNDFMELLIQLKNKGTLENEEYEKGAQKGEIGTSLTLNETAAQAFIFFLAGFETSSTTMCFSMYELARNPDVQNKCREEIVRVLKKHDGQITYDSLLEMHYFERVIQEALRKFPPLMVLQRIATQDYKMPETEITIKKDTLVFIPVLALHKDPEYYPEPEKFDPDRFTEAGKASRPDYTYLPFGEGPRVCIGIRFAMMETKVGLCQLLLNYKFTINPKTKEPLVMDPSSAVSTARDGIWLNAEKIAT